MSDTYGALNFPVQIPAQNESVHDPALDYIGAYFKACLNYQLGPSWQAVNPDRKFVETYEVGEPDETFNERDLPAIFIYRSMAYDEQISDDWNETCTDVSVTWVPQNAVQAKRALRSTGVNGFQKVISRALELGRSPVWIDPSDDDPSAKTLGSCLMTRAGFYRPPYLVSAKTDRVTIQKGRDYADYTAFTVVIKIHEITQWNNSFDSITMANRAPSKLNETVSSGDFSISKLVPTT